MKNKPLDDDDIRSRLSSEIQNATGFLDDEITSAREDALRYYHGEEPAEEGEGRSSVVSTDVRDTIEWILPQLMRIFSGDDRMAEFLPVGPEDVGAAEQETDTVNYVLMKQNKGWRIFYEWFKDALLSKNGYVRCAYERTDSETTETYENLTDAELMMLMQDPELEATEHESQELATEQGIVTLHAIKFTRRRQLGRALIECVPPERVLISRQATSIDPDEADFFGYYDRKSRSDLIDMGLDEEAIDKLSQDDEEFRTGEEFTRKSLNTSWYQQDSAAEDFYWIYECYLTIDIDGTGHAKRWKFIVGGAGYDILDREEVDRVPFACLTPNMLSHQHFGLSIADMVMEIQRVKTALIRAMQDNIYLTNNPRTEVVAGQVNLDDLLTSRVGGLVRVKQPNMMREIVTPFMARESFPLLEYWDKVRGERTGASDQAMGLDANVLQNATAGAIAHASSQAMLKVELIARLFAETGVKDLMLLIHETLRKYQDREMVVRLRNQFIPVRPQEWRERADMTVNVGLGTGGREERLAVLQAIWNAQTQAMQAGLPVVSPQHVYHTLSDMAKLGGQRDPSRFFQDPSELPPPEPPGPTDTDKMLAANAQIEQMKALLRSAEIERRQREAEVRAEMDAMREGLEHVRGMTKLELEYQRNVPGSAV